MCLKKVFTSSSQVTFGIWVLTGLSCSTSLLQASYTMKTQTRLMLQEYDILCLNIHVCGVVTDMLVVRRKSVTLLTRVVRSWWRPSLHKHVCCWHGLVFVTVHLICFWDMDQVGMNTEQRNSVISWWTFPFRGWKLMLDHCHVQIMENADNFSDDFRLFVQSHHSPWQQPHTSLKTHWHCLQKRLEQLLLMFHPLWSSILVLEVLG